jgi:hypothetical protein
MEQVVPWAKLRAVAEPQYPNTGNVRLDSSDLDK